MGVGRDKLVSAWDRLKLILEAVEAQECDETLWPSKFFSGYENTAQDALRDLHLVIKNHDFIAAERIKKRHGAV